MMNVKRNLVLKFILILSLLLVGCSGPQKVEQLPLLTKEAYIDLVNQETTYYLYVGSDNCPYCNEFKPILEKALHSNEIIYYLDADKASESFKNELAQTLNIQTIPYLAQVEGDTVLKQLNYQLDLTPEDVRQFLD